MSETITKSISELLKPLPISHKLSAADLGTGSIPVYSSETQNNGIKGFCDNAIFKIDSEDFQRKQYIVFGDHTRSINVVCEDFSVMDNVKVLVPLYPNLSLSYIKSQWYNKIPQLGYARHWNVARKVKIEIPVNEKGAFDLEKQEQIAQKYKEVECKRNDLLDKIHLLKNVKVLLDSDNNIDYAYIPLNQIITHNNGKSIYTKEFCQAVKGDFPVYSANNKTPLAHINLADYNGTFLTYSKNGCAGYISVMSGEFSVNGDRCVITLNDGFEDIDLLYLKYFLEPIFRANIKGRIGIDGKNEYTKINGNMIKKLNIVVPIPIKADKTFDVEKQRALAQKYATIDSIKNDVYKQIAELTSITVI